MPNMDFEDHDTWYPDPTVVLDDLFIFVYAPEGFVSVAIFDGDLQRASDFASMFPHCIYFLAHVQEL